MGAVSRAVAVATLTALVVALASPCPPRAEALVWPRPALAHHAQAAADGGGADSQRLHPDDCAHATPEAVLAAPCPCGCDQRPQAATGVSLELTHSLTSRAPAFGERGASRLGVSAPDARLPLASATIDHVPLAV